jgi:hypothetical protein
MTFYPGQRVFCVKTGEWLLNKTTELTRDRHAVPVYGEIYVIRRLYTQKAKLYLILCDYEDSGGFNSVHFRPLVDTQYEALVSIAANPPKNLVKALHPVDQLADVDGSEYSDESR